MRIRLTDQFLDSHDDYISYMDKEREKKGTESAVVDLDMKLFDDLIQHCVDFATAVIQPSRVRSVGIITAKGARVAMHDHDDEFTVLYYIQGGQPLVVYQKVEGWQFIKVYPGLMVYLPPFAEHKVETETMDRYSIGVLMQP